MSIDDRIAADQPKTFKFTAENEKEIKRIIAKYPKGRQVEKMVQYPPNLAIQHADILGTARHFNAQRIFHSQCPRMFLIHRRYIIKPVKIRQCL